MMIVMDLVFVQSLKLLVVCTFLREGHSTLGIDCMYIHITAQKTYRTGVCAFSEFEHCRKVINKLQTLTSIAEGFEKEELLNTRGRSEELESSPQRPEDSSHLSQFDVYF